MRRAETDAGQRPGLLTDERARIKQIEWKNRDFATMTYVDWFNHRRLHGEDTNDAGYAPAIEAMTQ